MWPTTQPSELGENSLIAAASDSPSSSGVVEEPWEVRHWLWVHYENNPCPNCEDPDDRGFDRPLALDRWARLLMACSGRWLGLVQPLLRRRSRRPGRGVLVWDAGTSPASSAGRLPSPSLDDLRRVAEDAEFWLHVAQQRGAVQSLPRWWEELDALDATARSAWHRYADALFA